MKSMGKVIRNALCVFQSSHPLNGNRIIDPLTLIQVEIASTATDMLYRFRNILWMVDKTVEQHFTDISYQHMRSQ